MCIRDSLQGFDVKGLTEEGQRDAVGSQRRFNDVWNVAFVGVLVEVIEGLAAGLLMAAQVIVGAVGDAPQLSPAEGEEIFDISGRFGVCLLYTSPGVQRKNGSGAPPGRIRGGRRLPAALPETGLCQANLAGDGD